MRLFFGPRETLNEKLAREAGLSPERERRRPVRGIWAWRRGYEQRKLAKYAAERAHLSEQEAALSREEFRLRAPDTPPPGFG